MWQTSRKRREDNHAGSRFFGQQVRKLLAKLNFRHDHLDARFLDRGDEALELKGGRFTAGLRLNRSHDLESKSPCKVGPCGMMHDNATIGHTAKPIGEVGAELVQFSQRSEDHTSELQSPTNIVCR